MNWNYRILAHKDGDNWFYQIHEVYYDENNLPNGLAAVSKKLHNLN